MLQPKRFKFHKQSRGRMKGNSIAGSRLEFGGWGIKSLGRGWFTAEQIEAARKAISHFTKRNGRLWLRVFPDKPVTQKAAGARMGAGKGEVEHYVAVIKPGRILFELSGVPEDMAMKALGQATKRIPFPTKIIVKA